MILFYNRDFDLTTCQIGQPLSSEGKFGPSRGPVRAEQTFPTGFKSHHPGHGLSPAESTPWACEAHSSPRSSHTGARPCGYTHTLPPAIAIHLQARHRFLRALLVPWMQLDTATSPSEKGYPNMGNSQVCAHDLLLYSRWRILPCL